EDLLRRERRVETPAAQAASAQQPTRIELRRRPPDDAVVVGEPPPDRDAASEPAPLKRKERRLELGAEDADGHVGAHGRDELCELRPEERADELGVLLLGAAP